LRRLAVNDESTLAQLHGPTADRCDGPRDARLAALVQVGGLVAMNAAETSYQWSIARALAAGATEDEIIDVLISLLPIVGTARVHSAAPAVYRALGCADDAS
jgi:alkylhydroperoxidase/carboxymuconolactone decarboxylase family protein YurZ